LPKLGSKIDNPKTIGAFELESLVAPLIYSE
jgi:hypothetical protein